MIAGGLVILFCSLPVLAGVAVICCALGGRTDEFTYGVEPPPSDAIGGGAVPHSSVPVTFPKQGHPDAFQAAEFLCESGGGV